MPLGLMASMPRTTLPPTPASSTDIPGMDGTKQLASLQMSFELPPPAMTASRSRPTSSHAKTWSYPVQPSETVKSRRRASAAPAATKDSFALPPPPTRSRKIIQMKPRPQAETSTATATSSKGTAANSKTAAVPPPAASTDAAGSGVNKKKQPSATSAAGRKIARKTAHSLIERRRRSKMNEEFSVLKSMIPACTGEMHKLSILQASIEYVKYLEDCIAKLKMQRDEVPPRSPVEMGPPTPSAGERPWVPDRQISEHSGQLSPDADMTDLSETPSPTFTSRSQLSSVSPALPAQAARTQRHESYSSAISATDRRHYSHSSASANVSPAFGPNQPPYAYAPSSNHSASGSTLTSPALPPMGDLDQEATAALLMLNSDRRATNPQAPGAGRGMSVRDLLST